MEETSSKTIRVVLFGLHGVLGEITEAALTAEPDIELAASPVDAEALIRAVSNSDVDVAILGCQDRELPPIGRKLLLSDPTISLLTICDDGRASFLYEVRPFEVPLGEVSPQGLLDAVRSVRERVR